LVVVISALLQVVHFGGLLLSSPLPVNYYSHHWRNIVIIQIKPEMVYILSCRSNVGDSPCSCGMPFVHLVFLEDTVAISTAGLLKNH